MGAPALVNALGGALQGTIVGVLMELFLLDVIAYEKALAQPHHLLTFLVVGVNIATFMALDWYSEVNGYGSH